MKIRLLSDLHAEFYRRYGGFNEPSVLAYQGEDVLVLAGDIGVGCDQVVETIEKFLDNGAKQIVYVTGNHEYYNQKFTDVEYDLEAAFKNIPEVSWLREGKTTKIGNVHFIGGTLWTNFREEKVVEAICKTMISDFRVINGFSINLAKHLFYTDLEGIRKSVRQLGPLEKKVVVTHFLPSDQCIHHKYLQSTNTSLNKYFANDLFDMIYAMENTTWMFGHTHEPAQLRIGTTNLYCNPMGYPGEHQSGKFDPALVITV